MRTLLLGTAAIVVIGVAAFIVGSSALNPERLRDNLKEAVARATGRELSIAGGVHLRMGLAPRLEVDDISLANLAGASRPQMLTAKSLTAEVALFPLLAGDAVISSLTLNQPDIVLERGADGTGNWMFARPAHQVLYQGHGGAGSGGNSHSVEIRRLHVVGGQLTWQPPHGPAVPLAIRALDWSAESVDTPMTLALAGVWNGVNVDMKASAGSLQRLLGGPVSALAGSWPLTIDVAAADAGLHLEGGVNHPEQWRGYNFRMTLNAKAFASLSPLLGMGELPPLADVNATAVLQDGSQGELRTSQVSVHAGQSDLGAWAPGLVIKQALATAPGPGQLVQLSLEGTYQQQPLRLGATGTQPDVVGAGRPIQVTFSAQAAGATANAHGTIPPALDAPGLDLSVNAKAPDLSALSPLVGRILPPARDLALAAQLNDAGVKLKGIAVRDLTVTSSLGDLSGNVTVDWAPRGSISGTLSSQVLNLDAIAGSGGGLIPAIWPLPTSSGQVQPMPAPAEPQAFASTTAQAGFLFQGLPLASLRNNDADLALTVGDLTFYGQRFQDLQAHLQLSDGKLALNPFRAQSAEGAIIGGASIDATSDDPPVAVTLRSPAISAEAVAGLVGTPGGAHGNMQVDAQLSATGQTAEALRSSLGGHVGLAMVNGQIEDAFLQSLIGGVLDTAGIPMVGTGTSQVRCFAARVNFTQGTGTIRALAADTSKLTIDGTGTIDLAAQTASLHLRPRVRLGPTQVAAPVSLTGPIGALKASLDPVLDGGRVGITIGGGGGGSNCPSMLAVARGGLGGPLPVVAPADPGQTIRKPKDLLQGLFH